MTSTLEQTSHLRLVAANGLRIEQNAAPQPVLVVCPFAEELWRYDRVSGHFMSYEHVPGWSRSLLRVTLRPLTADSTAVLAIPVSSDLLRDSHLQILADIAPVGRVVIHGGFDVKGGMGWSESFNLTPGGNGATVHLLSLEYLQAFGASMQGSFTALNTALAHPLIGGLHFPHEVKESPTVFAMRAASSEAYAGVYIVDIQEEGHVIDHRQLW